MRFTLCFSCCARESGCSSNRDSEAANARGCVVLRVVEHIRDRSPSRVKDETNGSFDSVTVEKVSAMFVFCMEAME